MKYHLKCRRGGDKPDSYEKNPTDICNIPIYSNGIENNGLYGFTNKPRVIEPSITISARGTIGFCCIREVPFVPIVRLITITPSKEFELYYLKTVFEALIETIKSKILGLAIRGKLLPQDPNDKPASVLLERIRSEKEELIKQGNLCLLFHRRNWKQELIKFTLI